MTIESIGSDRGAKARFLAAVVAAVLAVFSAVPIAAQEAGPASRRETLYLRGAELRDPEAMRDGPVVLMGIEDSVPSFRSETPALDRAKSQPLQVDQDWLYRRKLRIFDQGGILHEVLPALVPRTVTPLVTRSVEIQILAGGDRSIGVWLLTGMTMLASALALFLWRHRHLRQVAAEIET